jgi:hypothetical protein
MTRSNWRQLAHFEFYDCKLERHNGYMSVSGREVCYNMYTPGCRFLERWSGGMQGRKMRSRLEVVIVVFGI